MDNCPYIRPGDTPDATQCSSGSKFIPYGLHKIFGCLHLRKYFNDIVLSKNVDLTIGVIPPTALGKSYTVTKKNKVKILSRPTKFLQRIHIYIGYGN